MAIDLKTQERPVHTRIHIEDMKRNLCFSSNGIVYTIGTHSTQNDVTNILKIQKKKKNPNFKLKKVIIITRKN